MELIKGFEMKIGMISIVLLLVIMMVKISSGQKNDEIKETGMFQYDAGKKLITIKPNVKNLAKLHFISVTTDQPIYWPQEEVFLKVLLPVNPSSEVEITVQRKDATPLLTKKIKLNDGGVLVEKIMSGKDKKLEAGEYRVDVVSADKKLKSYTTFSVVEGALGAVSFAYDFEELTDPKNLEKIKGGWYLGNAAGAGKRWGNGLNVKNEVRELNQPYTGKVTIKTRCFLPGCNGIEAGPPINAELKNGLLETVLDVSSHSGPFEIEVITDKGNVKNLFARSGHVERQAVQISYHLTNSFSATLAPYENTVQVYGRQVYIAQEKQKSDDALELTSPVCSATSEIEFLVLKDITNPKAFIYYPAKGVEFDVKEIPLEKELTKGKKVVIKCSSPYSFIGIAGFLKSDQFYEGWTIAFMPSSIGVILTVPEKAGPSQSVNIEVKAFDNNTKKGVPIYGILEVFDNRVASKSALEPLLSSVGDSFRELSEYFARWRDKTGIQELHKGYAKIAPPPPTSPAPAMPMRILAPSQASVGGRGADHSFVTGPEGRQVYEPIREGVKKVVYCGLVKTDANGMAKVKIELPPQMGRCKVRFVAVNAFEYFEKMKDIDVKKENYVEVNIQPLLIPHSKVLADALVVNTGTEPLTLKVSGGGVPKPLEFQIQPGSHEVQFEVMGENYGTLHLQLMDVNGKIRDDRQFEIKDVSTFPVTFSDMIISEGSPVVIEKGKKIALYSNPGKLLQGTVTNIVTTMYSWFGHAEAISAASAVRAILLRAIQDKLIDDEGIRHTLQADLVKGVKDLNERFFDKDKQLFNPYPGVQGNAVWSVWTVKNLDTMVKALEKNASLKKEFADTIKVAQEMIKLTTAELKKKGISAKEDTMYDPEQESVDVIPVEIDGKVVYRAITDDAVIRWYVEKMKKVLDLPECKTLEDINIRFVKAYDTYRFLRAFERTGSLYYLLLNAKGLLMKGNDEFYPLFNKIARGMILTKDPGMIQGPALLGGVYSAPQTLIKFLEIMIIMTEKHKIMQKPAIEIQLAEGTKTITLGDKLELLDTKAGAMTIKAPRFVTFNIAFERKINMYEYVNQKPFFSVKSSRNELKIGEETQILIQLDQDKDPTEYYAIIAVPSVLSLRQTEDLLTDYKGQLLYGQKTAGGEKIQLITVPFRGSRKMLLEVDAVLKGVSEGFVLVRHINNPSVIATVKMVPVAVR